MHDTDKDTLLTDLCAICHINAIKYTCPRCGIHTCSLPCVKRHKSWAQCSGVRDPAAYRKRADLATSASVDQDFNFITSVERSLQTADEQTSSKGLDLTPSGLRRDRKTKFDSAVEERKVSLIKAPKGLSRNKLNKSAWGGTVLGVVWTTEWLHCDGRKRTVNISESSTVSEAYQSAFGPKSFHPRKRKRNAVSKNPSVTPARDASSAQPKAPGGDDTAIHVETTGIRDEVPGSINPDSAHTTAQDNATKLEEAPDVYYYLFKPNTTSKVKCLIPLAADSKLIDCLRGRALLEFPTFYVRKEAPEGLAEPFMTEQKYNEVYGTDVLVNLPTHQPPDEAEEGEVLDLQNINEQKVLEVLQRDLNG